MSQLLLTPVTNELNRVLSEQVAKCIEEVKLQLHQIIKDKVNREWAALNVQHPTLFPVSVEEETTVMAVPPSAPASASSAASSSLIGSLTEAASFVVKDVFKQKVQEIIEVKIQQLVDETVPTKQKLNDDLQSAMAMYFRSNRSKNSSGGGGGRQKRHSTTLRTNRVLRSLLFT